VVVEAEVNGRTTSLLRVKGEVSFAGAVGQPRFESSLLGDPGAKFSTATRCGQQKKEKPTSGDLNLLEVEQWVKKLDQADLVRDVR